MVKVVLPGCKINFPTVPSEVSLGNFLDCMAAYIKFNKWESEYQGEYENEYFLTYIRHCFECIYGFTKNNKIEKALTGDFKGFLARIGNRKNIKQIDLSGSAVTMFDLFTNTLHFLENYKTEPILTEDFIFKYKRKTFVIKGLYRDALTGQLIFKSLETGQAIEAQKVTKVWADKKEEDPELDARYTMMLQLLAITALEKDKPFPLESENVALFINNQVEFFREINMDIALKVEDFFFGTMRALRIIQGSNTFLTHQNMMVQPR